MDHDPHPRQRLSRASSSVRSLLRLVHYVLVTVRFGLAVAWRRVAHRDRFALAASRYVVPMLTSLGATPVKVGQLIASAPGTFPPGIVAACSELRDHVESEPIDVEALLAGELGASARCVSRVDPRPIAAASIAQVYRGRLVDGREVAIKVRRHKVVAALAADIRILRRAIRVLSWLVPSLRRMDLVGSMDGLSALLADELDFEAERRNGGRMATALAGSGTVVPEYVDDLCTPAVLVMTYLPGPTLSAGATELVAGGEGEALARRIVTALLWPLANGGVFHADMHAGNLIVGPDRRLGLVDFGAVCTLGADTRDRVVAAFGALFDGRFDEAGCAMLGLVDTTGCDLTAAAAALAELAAESVDRGASPLPLGAVVRRLLAIASAHQLRLSAHLTALLRQLVLLDGIIGDLACDFDFSHEAGSVLASAVAHRSDSLVTAA